MRTWALIALLVLAGCDAKVPGLCDYCHADRPDVHRYHCEKCKGSHLGCEVDQGLVFYAPGTAGAAKWVATMPTCPEAAPAAAPPPPAPAPAAPPLEEEDRYKTILLAFSMVSWSILIFIMGRQNGIRYQIEKIRKGYTP